MSRPWSCASSSGPNSAIASLGVEVPEETTRSRALVVDSCARVVDETHVRERGARARETRAERRRRRRRGTAGSRAQRHTRRLSRSHACARTHTRLQACTLARTRALRLAVGGPWGRPRRPRRRRGRRRRRARAGGAPRGFRRVAGPRWRLSVHAAGGEVDVMEHLAAHAAVEDGGVRGDARERGGANEWVDGEVEWWPARRNPAPRPRTLPAPRRHTHPVVAPRRKLW